MLARTQILPQPILPARKTIHVVKNNLLILKKGSLSWHVIVLDEGPCIPDPNNAGQCLMPVDNGAGGSFTDLVTKCNNLGGHPPRPSTPADLAFIDTVMGGSGQIWMGMFQDTP